MPYEVFERRGSMSILIALLKWKKKKSMNITDLVKATGVNRESILRTVAAFAEYKIINEEHQEEWPFDHTVTLTELGRSAAQYMEEVAHLLGHPKTPLEPSNEQSQL